MKDKLLLIEKIANLKIVNFIKNNICNLSYIILALKLEINDKKIEKIRN